MEIIFVFFGDLGSRLLRNFYDIMMQYHILFGIYEVKNHASGRRSRYRTKRIYTLLSVVKCCNTVDRPGTDVSSQPLQHAAVFFFLSRGKSTRALFGARWCLITCRRSLFGRHRAVLSAVPHLGFPFSCSADYLFSPPLSPPTHQEHTNESEASSDKKMSQKR